VKLVLICVVKNGPKSKTLTCNISFFAADYSLAAAEINLYQLDVKQFGFYARTTYRVPFIYHKAMEKMK
jgi:hypothetical protein